MMANAASHVCHSTVRNGHRDPNLDLIRAVAILLVLVYHVVGMWPIQQPDVQRIASLGKHGVDLFFVLSGFLIGGIYFRELQQSGRVDGWRFWLRRAVRTMPPYFVALTLVYAAVRLTRGDPFEPSYLWFGQNYMVELPFFQASWSLCVEEHAYVAMVLGLGVLVALRGSIGPMLVAGCLLAAFMPLIDTAVRGWLGWAYRPQATHLWFGGIAMGVLASWTRAFHSPLWQKAKRLCQWCWPMAMLIACAITMAGKPWEPCVPFAMASASAAILVAGAGSRPFAGAASWITQSVAAISYSTYLTHGLVIHVGRMLRSRFPEVPDALMATVWLALIFGAASIFYWLVERPSITLRDRLLPSPTGTLRTRRAGLPQPSSSSDADAPLVERERDDPHAR